MLRKALAKQNVQAFAGVSRLGEEFHLPLVIGGYKPGRPPAFAFPQIVKLNAAETAMIEVTARQRLHNAHRALHQFVDAVRLASLMQLFGPATGAFRVPAEIIQKIPLRAARFTAAAFENDLKYWLFPKPAMGSCQSFATVGTVTHVAQVLS
jgi:hypothetical protein